MARLLDKVQCLEMIGYGLATAHEHVLLLHECEVDVDPFFT